MRKLILMSTVVGLSLAACAQRGSDYRVGEVPTDRSGVEQEFSRRADARFAQEDFEVPPKVIAAPMPQYPPGWASHPELQGDVTVKFTIDLNGLASDPTVVGSPSPELAALALQAILRWRFSPAKKNGVAVTVRAVQRFSFQIKP